MVEVATYFSGGGGLHGGQDTDGEKEHNLPHYHLFQLASAEICLSLFGLWSLVYEGCFMQDAPSLLHRLSRGPGSQCHVSAAVGCRDCSIVLAAYS